MPDRTVMAVEGLLDASIRVLMRAAARAESLRDQSLSDDIYMIANEVARLLDSLS